MKQTLLAVALGAAMVSGMASAVELKTDEQKESYAIGLQMGLQLLQIDNIDFKIMTEGMKTTYNQEKPQMTPEELNATLQGLQKKLQEKQVKAFEKLSADNLEKGKAYLAKNAKKDGVKTTESGLQYEELVAGKGKQPAADDTVKVHYRGTLIDGTEFDSSYARNEPVSFSLDGVIAGWKEGVPMIKEGGKARLVIPADLAYGPRGMGNAIGPNEVLIFEIELLEINPSTEEPEATKAK
ncbi:MAG: peptidylprolyl isomerase [Neptuniibacter caesariensis]|uniref:Peptidyl-prolyl cis-trans isomerase n=1 Tax=Neptuniibacter caesariensis TaxID=207954 RepID=A0A2G6JDQ6_NEPCE|nr:MAG: peptidylprolyl isomerase [Neptuniibacter caesariensis]